MCLLIHKPAHARIPDRLLASAASFNPHGIGIMTWGDGGRLLVRRRSRTTLAELRTLYAAHRDEECVIHLRYRTSGNVDRSNTHPIRVTRDIYMAHNGTLNIDCRLPGQSDTWHLVQDYLRPILRRRADVLHDRTFQKLVATWVGRDNRIVFMDGQSRRTVIINRERGVKVGALWLSNTRWFDASQFAWHRAAIPRSPARSLQFSL